MANHVVILAGGAGTRFWPSGRRARPKQLLKITGERTMLGETVARCGALASAENTYVITAEIQAEATRKECPTLLPEHVVAEPSMRNTAAAIGVAAALVARADPDGVMIVLPADHHIQPQEKFEACYLAAAERAAQADVLLTVGVQPTGPATGYGYIEGGEQIAIVGEHPVHRVLSFKEKPDAATAAEFIESGRYFWNAGTFVWRASTLLKAFEDHLPGHHEVLQDIGRRIDAGEGLRAEEYDRFENVPIDIGVMEKADNVEVIPASFEWDDVGSWLAIDRLRQRDGNGNVALGRHIGVDTRDCIVFTGGRLVATLGLEDMIIVQTDDATLVCPKDRAEEVKKIVEKLKLEGLDEYL